MLDEFALPDYDILAVYPQQRYVPAKVRYFIDYLKGVYAEPGYLDAVKAGQRISPTMPGCLQFVSRTPAKRFSTVGNHMSCRKD